MYGVEKHQWIGVAIVADTPRDGEDLLSVGSRLITTVPVLYLKYGGHNRNGTLMAFAPRVP
jgi:hypothetical protein